jgi:hypothetical protein
MMQVARMCVGDGCGGPQPPTICVATRRNLAVTRVWVTLRLCWEATANDTQLSNSLMRGKIQGNFVERPLPACVTPWKHQAS